MVSKGLNKILFILSKPQSQKAYNNIEYEIKKGIVNEYISQIPQDIDVSGI